MKLSVFFALVTYACATTFSPGPNNVLLLSSTGQFGFRKCLPLMRGIWTGLITVMLICGFGCAFLGDHIPSIEKYARFVGAAYILWLGCHGQSDLGDSRKSAVSHLSQALPHMQYDHGAAAILVRLSVTVHSYLVPVTGFPAFKDACGMAGKHWLLYAFSPRPAAECVSWL